MAARFESLAPGDLADPTVRWVSLLTALDDGDTGRVDTAVADAFGALAGPQQFDVLGKHVELQASPSAVSFSNAGAVITMNLQVKLAGSEGSRGFVYTPNGMPTMTPVCDAFGSAAARTVPASFWWV